RAVGQPVQPSRRVDARDPQPAEVALAQAPVLVGELTRALQRLQGGLEQLAAAAVIALRGGEHPAPAGACGDDGFGAWHRSLSMERRGAPGARAGCFTGTRRGLPLAEHPLDAGLVDLGDKRRADELALAAARLADHAVTQPRVGALGLARAGQLEALRGRTVGLHLGHLYRLLSLSFGQFSRSSVLHHRRSVSRRAWLRPPFALSASPRS